MTNINKSGVVPGMVGAVVGAGVAVAATRVLSDKKTRKVVMDTVVGIKDHVIDSLHEAQKSYNMESAVKTGVQKGKKEAKKVIAKELKLK